VADVPSEAGTQPSPAVKAGLQTNDVIVEFNGQPVQDHNDLIAKVAGTAVGQTVTITFLRDVDGKLDRRSVSVTLAERLDSVPRDVELPSPKDKPDTVKSSTGRIGLTLAELTPQQITEKHLTGVKGLYVKEVDPNGLAADIRPYEINAGEVVTRVNRVPVTTLADFQRVVESLKPGDAIVLNLSRFDRSSNPNRVVQRIVQFTYQ
jgi:serine protease Do